MPGADRSPQPDPAARARWRWTAWLLAAIAAGLVLWALTGPPRGAPPLDDIDAASRKQLDDALRDAERAEPAP